MLAQKIERKIIIENNQYYYTTIDEEHQLATLHIGNCNETLIEGEKFALPAGRNFDAPIIPFSWDISNGFIYAINFLQHPLNDRNEALKKIKISTLREWDSTTSIINLLMTSVDYNTFTMNDPYLFTVKRSNVLSNFYFDGIMVNDSTYCMAISNNGELSVWTYSNATWTHSDPVPFQLDGYFTVFTFKNKVYLHFRHGFVYEVLLDKKNPLKSKKTGTAPVDGILIDNRDKGSIEFIRSTNLNKDTPLNELIKENGITIF
jgi:hypothetical protein